MKFAENEYIGVFVMVPEFCDNLSPMQLQKSYFEDELIRPFNKEKTGKDYRYYMKNSFCISKEVLENKNIHKILFIYQNYIIAAGEFGNYDLSFFTYNEKKSKGINDELDDLSIKSEYELKRYIKFDKIITFPIFIGSILENEKIVDQDEYGKNQTTKKGYIYKVKNANELNKITSKKYDDNVNSLSLFHKLYEEQKIKCLLKEIKFYNIEDIHTNFLASFLDKNNIYGLGDKPFINFLNILNDKKGFSYSNNDNIILKNVYSQYSNPTKSGKKVRIDLSIDFLKNNEKYKIILEAKLNSYQSLKKDIDGKNISQTKYYYDDLEFQPNTKVIFVFLAINDEEKIDNHYIRISYQDLIDKVYMNYYHKNYYLLEDYLCSFHYMVDDSKFYNTKNISLIPNTHMFDNDKNLYKEIDIYLKRLEVENKIPKFNNINEIVLFKYLISNYYQIINNKKEKNIYEKFYKSLNVNSYSNDLIEKIKY